MMLGGYVVSYVRSAYIDFTLRGSEISPDIFINLLYSICLLNESFNYRYDLPATILIFGSTSFIVYLVKLHDRPKIEGQKLRDYLHSWPAIILMTLLSVQIIAAYFFRKKLIRRLREFEAEADLYDNKLLQEKGEQARPEMVLPADTEQVSQALR